MKKKVDGFPSFFVRSLVFDVYTSTRLGYNSENVFKWVKTDDEILYFPRAQRFSADCAKSKARGALILAGS